MAKSGVLLEPIATNPGVQPATDKTNVASNNYAYSDKIRYESGLPQKIGGWDAQEFDYDAQIEGYVRSVFTDFINGKFYVMIGSNEKLYALIGSRLTNITPL